MCVRSRVLVAAGPFILLCPSSGRGRDGGAASARLHLAVRYEVCGTTKTAWVSACASEAMSSFRKHRRESSGWSRSGLHVGLHLLWQGIFQRCSCPDRKPLLPIYARLRDVCDRIFRVVRSVLPLPPPHLIFFILAGRSNLWRSPMSGRGDRAAVRKRSVTRPACRLDARRSATNTRPLVCRCSVPAMVYQICECRSRRAVSEHTFM